MKDKQFRKVWYVSCMRISRQYAGRPQAFFHLQRGDDMDGRDYFEKGQKAFVIGDHEASFNMFDKALEEGYEPIKTLLSRGAAYINIEDYDKALQDFDRVLEMDGNNERAYYYRGVTKLKKGQFQQAAEDLDHTLALNPERGAAFFARGIARAELDREDQAIADFKQAVAYSHVETERFLNMFGSDRTAFQRSMALLQGERGPLTRMLNTTEIEKLKRWIEH